MSVSLSFRSAATVLSPDSNRAVIASSRRIMPFAVSMLVSNLASVSFTRVCSDDMRSEACATVPLRSARSRFASSVRSVRTARICSVVAFALANTSSMFCWDDAMTDCARAVRSRTSLRTVSTLSCTPSITRSVLSIVAGRRDSSVVSVLFIRASRGEVCPVKRSIWVVVDAMKSRADALVVSTSPLTRFIADSADASSDFTSVSVLCSSTSIDAISDAFCPRIRCDVSNGALPGSPFNSSTIVSPTMPTVMSLA